MTHDETLELLRRLHAAAEWQALSKTRKVLRLLGLSIRLLLVLAWWFGIWTAVALGAWAVVHFALKYW